MKYVGNKLPILVRALLALLALLPFCTQKMKSRLVKNYGIYEDEKILKEREERERRHKECKHGKCLSVREKKPKKTIEELEEFYSKYEQNSYDILLNSTKKTIDELRKTREENEKIKKLRNAEEIEKYRSLYIGKGFDDIYDFYDADEFSSLDIKELNIKNEGDENIAMREGF